MQGDVCVCVFKKMSYMVTLQHRRLISMCGGNVIIGQVQ